MTKKIIKQQTFDSYCRTITLWNKETTFIQSCLYFYVVINKTVLVVV